MLQSAVLLTPITISTDTGLADPPVLALPDRRNEGLQRLRVLLGQQLSEQSDVPHLARAGGRPAAEAARQTDGLLLPARQVPHRGEVRAGLRREGRVQREVGGPVTSR